MVIEFGPQDQPVEFSEDRTQRDPDLSIQVFVGSHSCKYLEGLELQNDDQDLDIKTTDKNRPLYRSRVYGMPVYRIKGFGRVESRGFRDGKKWFDFYFKDWIVYHHTEWPEEDD